MEVRLIKPEEAVDYLKISAASFIWKFNKDEDKEVEIPVLGAFDEGRLVAGVELFDFKCNYCGNLINTVVLSGVCSQPECRGKGAVRAIFDEVGRTAVENDIVAGFLAPFSISYKNLREICANSANDSRVCPRIVLVRNILSPASLYMFIIRIISFL